MTSVKFLADDEIRGKFYDALCVFGRALSSVLNSEKAYAAFEKWEIAKYQSAFIFYSKVRRSVKIRYADVIDNREYEKQMQNLLDTHMSVVGIKQITNPVDILNKEELEKETSDFLKTKLNINSTFKNFTYKDQVINVKKSFKQIDYVLSAIVNKKDRKYFNLKIKNFATNQDLFDELKEEYLEKLKGYMSRPLSKKEEEYINGDYFYDWRSDVE